MDTPGLDHTGFYFNGDFIFTINRMKMRWYVIFIIHCDDDSKESGNLRLKYISNAFSEGVIIINTITN